MYFLFFFLDQFGDFFLQQKKQMTFGTQAIRTTFQPISSRIKYQLLYRDDVTSRETSESDSSSQKTEGSNPLECDLLVVPIWHDPSNPMDTKTMNSGGSGSTISNHFVFQKLDSMHKQILTKQMKEQSFDPKKGGQYVITRVFGDDMTYNYPKKIALVGMGKHSPRDKQKSQSSNANQLIPSAIEQSRVLGSTIQKIVQDYKSIQSVH
ncbi:hypothetical protein RFI_13820, partial [Reticulomyxa filosa]